MVYNNGFGVKIITQRDQDKLQRGSYNYVALYNNSEYSLHLTNDRSTEAMAEVYIEGEKVGTWLIPAKESITVDRPVDVQRKFTFFRETDSRAISAGVTPGEEINGLIKVIFYPKKSYVPVRAVRDSFTGRTTVPTREYTQQVAMTQMLNQSPQVPVISGSLPQVYSPRSPSTTLASPRSPSRLSSTVAPLPQTSSFVGQNRSVTSNYASGATVLGSQSYQTFGSARRFSDNEIDWANKTEIVIRLVVKPNTMTIATASRNSWTSPINREFVSIKDMLGQSVPPRIDNYMPLF